MTIKVLPSPFSKVISLSTAEAVIKKLEDSNCLLYIVPIESYTRNSSKVLFSSSSDTFNDPVIFTLPVICKAPADSSKVNIDEVTL